ADSAANRRRLGYNKRFRSARGPTRNPALSKVRQWLNGTPARRDIDGSRRRKEPGQGCLRLTSVRSAAVNRPLNPSPLLLAGESQGMTRFGPCPPLALSGKA